MTAVVGEDACLPPLTTLLSSSYSSTYSFSSIPSSSQSSTSSFDAAITTSSSHISQSPIASTAATSTTSSCSDDAWEKPGRRCQLPTPTAASTAIAAPVETRQHPRRTQRLKSDGHAFSQGLRPPSLVRQSDRKVNFVDSLVDTTTQMVETIWPLSAYMHSRHSGGSRQPSRMDLRYFIQEVLRRSKTSYSTLQVALYYLILIRSCMPRLEMQATTRDSPDSPSTFSLQCGRRMFIAALILASKYLQDRNFSAHAWSKISGLSTWDLNTNEMAFLQAINWKLHIPEARFHRWTDLVLRYSPSSQVNNNSSSTPLPRSSSSSSSSKAAAAAACTWRNMVLRLTPELEYVDTSEEFSDDSGYDSPGSSSGGMSPPSYAQDQYSNSLSSSSSSSSMMSPPSTRQPTPPPLASGLPGPHSPSFSSAPSGSAARAFEGRASEARTTTLPSSRILPPLQPRLAPLPTPDLTPQVDALGTPAVSSLRCLARSRQLSLSVSGNANVGVNGPSSMSLAMSRIRDGAALRTMDCTSTWQCLPSASSVRRSSPMRSVEMITSSAEEMLSSGNSSGVGSPDSGVDLHHSRASSVSSAAVTAASRACHAAEAGETVEESVGESVGDAMEDLKLTRTSSGESTSSDSTSSAKSALGAEVGAGRRVMSRKRARPLSIDVDVGNMPNGTTPFAQVPSRQDSLRRRCRRASQASRITSSSLARIASGSVGESVWGSVAQRTRSATTLATATAAATAVAKAAAGERTLEHPRKKAAV